MANERRLIDADAAIERLKLEGVMRYPQNWGMGLLAAMETIRSFPTVDAVEVVRCGQCKYREECIRRIEFMGRNPVLEQNTYEYHPLDYCSYGEKSDTQPQREDV